MRSINTLLLYTAIVTAASSMAVAAPTSSGTVEYPFTVTGNWEVPQASLPAGKYVISVQDRLLDRHIFQVRDANGKVVSTFLAIPFRGASDGPLTFWKDNGPTKYIRAWKPANEDMAWELVYPKDKAVQIATDAHTPVPAVILPDTLTPANPFLSNRDLQSIQMWMLTPKRVSGNVQMAVAKIGRTAPAAPTTVASASDSETRRMPHTASGFGDSILLGTILMMSGGFLALRSRKAGNRA